MGIFRSRHRIKRLLIANRGEIAVRIIETARKTGIQSYVIKSIREPKALYLQLADKVIDAQDESDEIVVFLDVERIIELARKHNIDAIHPGYGFLAENPYFAKRCEEENITFVGPSADAIYKMGNKTIAKQIARKHKVPLLQGSIESLKSEAEALKLAKEIGFPVILKAASGGGGRGMRIVENERDMKKMYRLASNEAQKAFNDSSVFIEKYVRNPRHVEFQIMADKRGHTIHLGERECSIQRKHQKLVEEAPSPALDEKLRKEMGEVAVRMAKAVDYYSAGTVEFLLDEDNNYYFMEMNTRIQVEHPVTEMITGLDLIELQLKIAENKNLTIKQEEVSLNGWAFEFRINAEDVQANFSPNLGVIEQIAIPKGRTVRVDTGVQNGSEITPYYDSMIAKLIVYGNTRRQAITNALNAIKRIKIKGLKTTIPFCKAVLYNTAFREGRLNTAFIEKEMQQLYYQEPYEELLASFVAISDFIGEIEAEEKTPPDYDKAKDLSPWTLNKRLKSL